MATCRRVRSKSSEFILRIWGSGVRISSGAPFRIEPLAHEIIAAITAGIVAITPVCYCHTSIQGRREYMP